MTKKQKKSLIQIVITAVLVIILQFIPFPENTVFRWIRLICYLVPYMIAGYGTLKKALRGIAKRQVFDENFLMAVATLGALAIAIYENGEYTEAIAVMLFYQIGELFESYAVGKSRKNISELMDIRPDYANVETDGSLEKKDPDEIEVGTVIVVLPGERVPIDGIVTEGTSSLDTSALTGESVPETVKSGEEIISGCINMTSVLKIQTTKEFGESTVSRILDLVENASSKKSKSENFISKFARIYTPAVCYCALALAILPPAVRLVFLNAAPMWGNWVYRALTFLVISCPCALVISIPLSFFAGIGGAGHAGILVKGSGYLETLSKVKCVVFDKTGTMTEGVFEVTGIRVCNGFSACGNAPAGDDNRTEAGLLTDRRLLELAAHAESFSSHPIAQSIMRAYGKTIDQSCVAGVEEISGCGVSAMVNGITVAAGNEKLMSKLGLTPEDCSMSGTAVHIAVDGIYAGYILISDKVKPTAKTSIDQLHRAGIRQTVMLTGDSASAAEQVAAELGIDRVYSELLPADKVAKVEELLGMKNMKETLAFAGDGINDAPVLARADIGIAMGAMGSDAAIEAADIVLMDDDPAKIPQAIGIAKKCMRIVYENIGFAIAVKLICLLLGAAGIANMWLAIFADVGVMVIAVMNAVRALYVKQSR